MRHLTHSAVAMVAALAVGVGCRHGPDEVPGRGQWRVALQVDGSRAVAEVDERYLSVALDSAQVLGGKFWSKGGAATSLSGDESVSSFDFGRPELRERLRSLAPAYLRIGGTAADVVHYEVGAAAAEPMPKGAELRLTAERWERITAFARDAGTPLLFTLNAGPSARDGKGAWVPDNAAALVAHAVARNDPVALWELGNEVNAYPLMYGLSGSVSGDQFGKDVLAARAMLERVGSHARLAAPASAFWPLVGEPHRVLEDALRGGGRGLDVISWHYYPQQSRRCPVAVRRAGPDVLRVAQHLDEIQRWGAVVEKARDRFAPAAEVWLSETGNAQCGGEPDVSDAFAGSLWWVDQLGVMARRGQRVMVRQTLAGSDYGLLDQVTLKPRPDYWVSVLWKRTMGTRVLAVAPTGATPVRAYAHCAARGPAGAVSVAVINLDPSRPAEVRLPFPLAGGERYAVTAPALTSHEVEVNGARLDEAESLVPVAIEEPLRLPPLSIAFAVLPAAAVPACGGDLATSPRSP